MKLSQTRLREIIQEEVARMNEDEERSFRKEFLKALGASNLKPTSRAIEMVLDVYEDSWVDAGDDRYLQDSAVADTVAALKLPPFNLKPEPKKELEEVDETMVDKGQGQVPARQLAGRNAPEGPGLQRLKADAIEAIRGITSAQGREDEIIQLFTNIMNIISAKKVDTPSAMTHLGRAKDAIEDTAK